MGDLKHSTTVVAADDGVSEVGSDEWNAAHKLNGSAYGAGSSFPGSPTSGDQFYRTDRNVWYYYDGTRWLTQQLFQHFGGTTVAISVTTDFAYYPPYNGQGDDWWLEDVRWSYRVATTHSATQFWSLQVLRQVGAQVGSTIDSDKSTINTWVNPAPTSLGVLLGTTETLVYFHIVKTSTPGTLLLGVEMRYRMVG